MKKISLIALLLLTCSLGTWAQAYEFEIKNGTCSMNNYVYGGEGAYAKLHMIEGIESPWDDNTKRVPTIFIDLVDSNGESKIRELRNKIGEGNYIKTRLFITLSDGSSITLDDRAVHLLEDNKGIELNLDMDILNFKKLITTDITGISIHNIHYLTFIALPSFHSAATLWEMSAAILQSMVNSSQINASATCEVETVVILSDGQLLCRLNNVRIKGANGNKVDIIVTLENINTGEDALVLDKTVTPTYEDSTYDHIFLKRNVQDEYSWNFPKNGGTFKVNVQFYMDSGKKDSKGHTLLDDIGEIKSNKRITIYRKADGSWRSY